MLSHQIWNGNQSRDTGMSSQFQSPLMKSRTKVFSPLLHSLCCLTGRFSLLCDRQGMARQIHPHSLSRQHDGHQKTEVFATTAV